MFARKLDPPPTVLPPQGSREEIRAAAIAEAEAEHGITLVCIGEGERAGTTRGGWAVVRVELFAEVTRSGTFRTGRTWGRFETAPDVLAPLFDPPDDTPEQVSETFTLPTARSFKNANSTTPPDRIEPAIVIPAVSW